MLNWNLLLELCTRPMIDDAPIWWANFFSYDKVLSGVCSISMPLVLFVLSVFFFQKIKPVSTHKCQQIRNTKGEKIYLQCRSNKIHCADYTSYKVLLNWLDMNVNFVGARKSTSKLSTSLRKETFFSQKYTCINNPETILVLDYKLWLNEALVQLQHKYLAWKDFKTNQLEEKAIEWKIDTDTLSRGTEETASCTSFDLAIIRSANLRISDAERPIWTPVPRRTEPLTKKSNT